MTFHHYQDCVPYEDDCSSLLDWVRGENNTEITGPDLPPNRQANLHYEVNGKLYQDPGSAVYAAKGDPRKVSRCFIVTEKVDPNKAAYPPNWLDRPAGFVDLFTDHAGNEWDLAKSTTYTKSWFPKEYYTTYSIRDLVRKITQEIGSSLYYMQCRWPDAFHNIVHDKNSQLWRVIHLGRAFQESLKTEFKDYWGLDLTAEQAEDEYCEECRCENVESGSHIPSCIEARRAYRIWLLGRLFVFLDETENQC